MHQWYLKLVLIMCLVKLKAAQIIYAKTPSNIFTCAAFIFCFDSWDVKQESKQKIKAAQVKMLDGVLAYII